MAKDPVCGMEVNEREAAATYEYKGKTYYFCAVGCKEKFAQNPEKFLKKTKEYHRPEEHNAGGLVRYFKENGELVGLL